MDSRGSLNTYFRYNHPSYNFEQAILNWLTFLDSDVLPETNISAILECQVTYGHSCSVCTCVWECMWMTQFLYYNFIGTNTHSFIPSPKQLQLIIGSSQTVSCSPFDQLSLSISLLYMPLVVRVSMDNIIRVRILSMVFLKGGHYLGKSNIGKVSK